jgi:predicted DNA-binding transcriptional regulator AlpA
MKLKKQMIRLSELRTQLNLSKSTLYRLRRKSGFPKPISIGSRSIFFDVEEVNQWLDKQPQLPY